MRKLPEINVPIGPFYRMMTSRLQTQMLLTAIELGVFDCLSAPKTDGEVADELQTHQENTARLLNGLTAIGLIHKDNGLYQNKPDTDRAFNHRSPACIADMLAMTQQMSADTVAGMTQLVRLGPPPDSCSVLDSEEVWAAYARSMANYQRGGIAQQMAGIISEFDEFPAFSKMLDLGGGPGMFCIAMVAEHPTMHGIVFDQPAVVKVAAEFIAEYEMQDRVSVMGGDYLTDPLGADYDLVWASATLNFARGDLVSMIRKIHAALAPGGVFVSLAEGTTHERTQPVPFILESLPFTLLGQDMMFDKGEIADAMSRAGFESVESRTVTTPFMPMDLDVARKAR